MTRRAIMDERKQNQNGRLFTRLKIGFGIGSAITVATAVIAQSICLYGQTKSKSAIKEGSSPLIFRIELSDRKRCQKSCVAVKAEVINESDEELAIDANGLKYQIVLDKLRTLPEGASSRSRTIQGDYGPNQYDEATYKVLA